MHVLSHIKDGPDMPNKSYYDPRKWWENIERDKKIGFGVRLG